MQADLDVVFVIDTDPAFTVPASWGIKEALGKVGTVVSVQKTSLELLTSLLTTHFLLITT